MPRTTQAQHAEMHDFSERVDQMVEDQYGVTDSRGPVLQPH